MKAIVYERYGSPSVLELREVEKPNVKDNEVLVRVYATTVTSADSRLRRLAVPLGFGLLSRVFLGIRGPRKTILGLELTGDVERVGKDVTLFKEGDQVFGSRDKWGCHAEYVALPEDGVIATKPSNMTYGEAAAVPFGALSSLVFLRDFGKIQSGQQVLINGASGGLGTFAVQLAKYYGAEVTGVCSASNVELVKSLGADKVIDYTEEDFSTGTETYDIVFDTVGTVSLSRCKSSLKQNGRCLLAVAGLPQLLHMLWMSTIGSKKAVGGVAVFKKKDLVFVKELIVAGKMRSVIDRRYPLEHTAKAHSYVDEGHKKGSVVITVKRDNVEPAPETVA
jgi:NADPH:quinone reductase-like Zn-dependent oxidoreductase